MPYQMPGGHIPYVVNGPYGVPFASPAGPAFSHASPSFSDQGAPFTGYQQPTGAGQVQGQNPHGSPHDTAHEPEHLKHDQHQYGQFMQLVNDISNGNADPSRVMNFLGSLDTQFWKGALVGVAAVLLLTNDTVKNGIASGLSGVMGVFGKEKKETQSE
jgi:hypothetical protein